MEQNKIPDWYKSLRQKHTRVMDALDELGKAARSEGPLDEKTSHLIQLAAAAAIRSEGAVHSHARRALKAGATRDEVVHALVLLVSTLGFPTVSAALSWVYDEFEKSA
ncbi:alkylhydroperoxidase AhpD family core domain-containing protein [Desulfacinum hydrothermale DSM 13146]|uniref:Alkylhydroperoxidase AhpD family core domain-containing protein n=1 Tax=Desulfacinum hydrothermale DSM 13146 TaxID=1121390 RepID=A0A1W1XL20_9BACT|nr:carboxymuconolactone decarboxylase family protein [Desulfacinum hydrothermale]SMC24669.1 alkylhydroperoxidase AhpD family core domain-containing protein [Desulfacinum hydrothermale DSM 13146]